MGSLPVLTDVRSENDPLCHPGKSVLLFVCVPAIGMLVNAARRGSIVAFDNELGLDGIEVFFMAMLVGGFVTAYLRRLSTHVKGRNAITSSLFGAGYGLGCGIGFAGNSSMLWGLAAFTALGTGWACWSALVEVSHSWAAELTDREGR